MPMSFPNLSSLRGSFDHPSMLPYIEGESEADYRERCAKWSETKYNDFVQAHEIRTGRGWDEWNETQKMELLKRRAGPAALLDLFMSLGEPRADKGETKL